jgi:putative sporulation protein YtaF
MFQYLSLLLLALAVSLDSFSVGFTYGLRKMSIPLKSLLTIACCSAVTLLLAMITGNAIASILAPSFAEKIGGLVLIGIGGWVLYQYFRCPKEKEHDQKTLLYFEIKSLGVVINILRKPMEADFDKSGTITGIEAVMLGFALSLDSFGAGIGAAILGYNPIIMAFSVAFMSSLFVLGGMKFGRTFAKSKWGEKFSFIPGVLLILIGILKM